MAKTTGKTPKLSGPAQVAVLQALTQQAASHLVGLDGKTVRESPTIPRNPDKSYDGHALLEWARSRIPAPRLNDVEFERMLVVADELFLHFGETALALVETLESFQRQHGDSGLIAFVHTMMTALRAEAAACRMDAGDRTARERLEIDVVCEFCGKLRRGRKWKKEKPAADRHVIKGACDACLPGEGNLTNVTAGQPETNQREEQQR